MARVVSALEPYGPFASATLADFKQRGVPHLEFFTVLARDDRLFKKIVSGNLVDPGHLSIRQREIAVARITARCKAEYEWGVHVALFGAAANLSGADYQTLFVDELDAAQWTNDERLILALVDSLLAKSDVGDDLWAQAREVFSAEAITEIVMVTGHYFTVCMLVKAWRLEKEPFARSFPVASQM